MYYESRGAIQNYAEALKWYRKSAEQGVALAQLGLGIMYAGGKGVTKDYVAAHMWFSLAAELGNEDSIVLMVFFVLRVEWQNVLVHGRQRPADPPPRRAPVTCPHERYHFLS